MRDQIPDPCGESARGTLSHPSGEGDFLALPCLIAADSIEHTPNEERVGRFSWHGPQEEDGGRQAPCVGRTGRALLQMRFEFR